MAEKHSSREPYATPSLQPQKLFVEAASPGCCKVSTQQCSDPMRTAGGSGAGKTLRGKTTS